METLTIHTIYEDGKLTPLTPLPCEVKEQVLLKVVRQSAVQNSQELLQGLDPAVVQKVADGDDFSILDLQPFFGGQYRLVSAPPVASPPPTPCSDPL